MYVLYLLYDLIDYTTLRVYRNDTTSWKNLCEDAEEYFDQNDIEYRKYVEESYIDALHRITLLDKEYDISVRDFTLEFFDDMGFNKC